MSTTCRIERRLPERVGEQDGRLARPASDRSICITWMSDPRCRTATLLEHVGKREACHDGVGGDAAYPAAELTTGIMPIGHVSSSYG